MQRTVVTVLLTVAIAIGVVGLVYAQQERVQKIFKEKMDHPTASKAMEKGIEQWQQGQWAEQAQQHVTEATVLGSVMQTNIVPSEDGAIVLAGGRLYKFNKNLELVKHTSLELDYTAMQHTIRQITQNLPKPSQERAVTGEPSTSSW